MLGPLVRVQATAPACGRVRRSVVPARSALADGPQPEGGMAKAYAQSWPWTAAMASSVVAAV